RTGFLPDSCGLSPFGILPYQRLQPVVDRLFRVRLFPVYQRSDLRSSGGSLLFSARPVHADEGVREFPRILQRGEKKGGGILGGMGGVLFGCDPWFLFLSGLGGGRLVPTIGPIQQFFPQVVVPLLIDGGSSLSSRNPDFALCNGRLFRLFRFRRVDIAAEQLFTNLHFPLPQAPARTKGGRSGLSDVYNGPIGAGKLVLMLLDLGLK